MYAKAAWERVIKQIKINSFFAMALLQGPHKMWGGRTILVGGTISILSGTGNNNVGRMSNSMVRVAFVVRGLSLAGGVGVVLGSVGPGGLSLVGPGAGSLDVAVFHVQGAPPNPEAGPFSWFLIHWHWLGWPFVSKKKSKESGVQ